VYVLLARRCSALFAQHRDIWLVWEALCRAIHSSDCIHVPQGVHALTKIPNEDIILYVPHNQIMTTDLAKVSRRSVPNRVTMS